MIDWSLASRPGSPPDLAPCELREREHQDRGQGQDDKFARRG